MKTKSLLNALLCCGFLFMLAGCQSSYVQNATLNAFVQNGDQFGELTTSINPQNLIFPAMSLTILNSHNLSQEFGNLTLTPGAAGGLATLAMTVDITAVTGFKGGVNDETLPNGITVPYLPLNVSTELTFAFGSGTSVSNSKAYVSLNPTAKTAAFGAALAIQEFSVAITPAYLFIPFTSNNISGMAGVFTGTAAGQSGFAVFADVSALENTADAIPSLGFFAAPKATPKAIYSSKEDAKRIIKMLKDLNDQHAHLTVLP